MRVKSRVVSWTSVPNSRQPVSRIILCVRCVNSSTTRISRKKSTHVPNSFVSKMASSISTRKHFVVVNRMTTCRKPRKSTTFHWMPKNTANKSMKSTNLWRNSSRKKSSGIICGSILLQRLSAQTANKRSISISVVVVTGNRNSSN